MNAPVRYLPNLVDDATTVFERLLNELKWLHVGDSTPRKEYYVHDQGLPYTYGTGKFARSYESQESHELIERIRFKLWNATAVEYDVVFLNLYEHERHHLGWHADDSPEMSDEHPIVTVSLGAEREIWFRENGSDNVERLLLQNGSAAIMLPGMQDTHQHRIPKSDRVCGPRISLTFRKFVYDHPAN